jgi:hypothetical protein
VRRCEEVLRRREEALKRREEAMRRCHEISEYRFSKTRK